MTTAVTAIDGDAVDQFVVDTVRDGAAEIVTVRGQVDVTTAPLLSAVLETVLGRRPTSVVVDLSGVTALDAYAASELMEARRRLLARDATLTARDPSPVARRALESTDLRRELPVLDSGIPGTAPGRTAGVRSRHA
jgi:anti-anti-sigma factor